MSDVAREFWVIVLALASVAFAALVLRINLQVREWRRERAFRAVLQRIKP